MQIVFFSFSSISPFIFLNSLSLDFAISKKKTIYTTIEEPLLFFLIINYNFNHNNFNFNMN